MGALDFSVQKMSREEIIVALRNNGYRVQSGGAIYENGQFRAVMTVQGKIIINYNGQDSFATITANARTYEEFDRLGLPVKGHFSGMDKKELELALDTLTEVLKLEQAK